MGDLEANVLWSEFRVYHLLAGGGETIPNLLNFPKSQFLHLWIECGGNHVLWGWSRDYTLDPEHRVYKGADSWGARWWWGSICHSSPGELLTPPGLKFSPCLWPDEWMTFSVFSHASFPDSLPITLSVGSTPSDQLVNCPSHRLPVCSSSTGCGAKDGRT